MSTSLTKTLPLRFPSKELRLSDKGGEIAEHTLRHQVARAYQNLKIVLQDKVADLREECAEGDLAERASGTAASVCHFLIDPVPF